LSRPDAGALQGRVFAFESQLDVETFVLIHALLDAGAVALPLNPRLTEAERLHLIQLSGAVRLLRSPEGWCIAQTSLPQATEGTFRSTHRAEVAVEGSSGLGSSMAQRDTGDAASDARAVLARPVAPTRIGVPAQPHSGDETGVAVNSTATSRLDRRLSSATPNRPQVLIATSGSTGPSKLVQLSTTALEIAAQANADHLQMHSTDRWLLSLNPAHIGGYSILMRCLHVGAAVVLDEDARDPRRLSDVIRRHGVTHVSLVPTQLQRWLAEPRFAPSASLRTVLVGGAACPVGLLARARGLGLPALATYGMSEACAQITTQPLTDLAVPEVRADCGCPVGPTELRIVDGTLEIRGPTLFDGYRTQPFPHDCSRPVDDDGWFATQDLGHLTTDGRFVPFGRRQDRIVTGGENVSPAEVEAVLLELPEVAQAVVVGLADPDWGQIVAAAVEREPQTPSDDGTWFERLGTALRGRLAAFKCPKRWKRLDALPRLPSGKLDRLAVIVTFEQEANVE
jgi:O-succinylbenzoic acid--CoA ligase